MIVCDDADFASVVPGGVHGLHPRRPGLRHADADAPAPLALRRGGRADQRGHGGGALRRSERTSRCSWGPVISARQRDRVLGYIEKGQQEGAKLVTGGGRPAHLPKGWFVEPTLFVDVDNSMTIAQEEIFGPVLAVIPYEDDDDAVRIANDSRYGLSGGVYSASEERATAIARRIRTGLHRRQRWPVVRGRFALRRLQGQRHRAPVRHRGLRAVRRDQGDRLARRLTPVGQRGDHSASSSSTVTRRATKARLCFSMDAWCSGGVPIGGVRRDRDGEVLVGGSDGDGRDGQVGRHTGHDDFVDAHVAQDRQHLGAVHR